MNRVHSEIDVSKTAQPIALLFGRQVFLDSISNLGTFLAILFFAVDDCLLTSNTDFRTKTLSILMKYFTFLQTIYNFYQKWQ